jgi:hypothetical protein
MEPLGGTFVGYGLFFACMGFVALATMGGLSGF